jgi:hypothetical protein
MSTAPVKISKITPEMNESFHSVIGQRVQKRRSGKPFKSGNKVNTVTGVIKHPKIDVLAFTFAEDDSYVACHICELETK